MPHLTTIVVAVSAVASVACSGQSPVTPSAARESAGARSARPSQSVAGTYTLSFHVFRNGTYVSVETLPVRHGELILRAYVTDSSGAPAQKGAVVFEYCSLKGGPPNDISRADEAPKEACDDGSAAWAPLDMRSVDAGTCPLLGTGFACMPFGIVQIPRTVGFRFRFVAKGGPIADGMSETLNFTWE